jgi:hypothetical protein
MHPYKTIKRHSRVNMAFYSDTTDNRMAHESLKIMMESDNVLMEIITKVLTEVDDPNNLRNRAIELRNRIENFDKIMKISIRERNPCTSSHLLEQTLRSFFLYPKELLLPSPTLGLK